uniref:Uncharacterized protein n=1 Tax=Tetranychus urticae TaxID=32264 RepID=T1L0B4_TETUR
MIQPHEIVHDVPAKKEEVSCNVASQAFPARSVSVGPQYATVSNVVSAPAQYSAWSGEVAASASGSWVSDPASWAQPKPSWKQGNWVKPASLSPVQPAYYGAEYPPTVYTNAHHAAT